MFLATNSYKYFLYVGLQPPPNPKPPGETCQAFRLGPLTSLPSDLPEIHTVTHPTEVITQTLHGTAIYAYIGVVLGINVGIYGIYGVFG